MVTEEQLKAGFLQAINELLREKRKVINHCWEIERNLTTESEESAQIDQMQEDLAEVAKNLEEMVSKSARMAQLDQDFWKKQKAVEDRYDELCAEIKTLIQTKTDHARKAAVLRAFISTLEEIEYPIDVFDTTLWTSTIEKVTIKSNGAFGYLFRNGSEIEVKPH